MADARRRGLPIATRDVRVARGDATLLAHVDVTIPADQRTFILGPNGSGKSTLLRVLHGLQHPTSGEVLWGESTARPPGQAMVFQRPVMLRRSAAANVRYALALSGIRGAEAERRIDDALREVGLGHLKGRAARALSGGEQQRLALARAWALAPEVLFLDEPTASLDPAATRAVEDIVRDIHGIGTTIVMTTHNLAQAKRISDMVGFFLMGKLVEYGEALQLFEAPERAETAEYVNGAFG